ncbi:MAG TPA: hypothetical protein VHG91_21390 [Longimicrobium sp.]|nr:hypothetical protein [Longimicrobium sp.]
MPIALRPRSTGEILDAGFQIVRQNYITLASAAAVFTLPLVALQLALPALAPLALFLQTIVQVFAAAATVVMVSEIYMGRRPDLNQALGAVGSKWGALLLAALGTGTLIFVGALLLIVPAFIFFAWTFSMPMVIMVEGRGFSAAFDRSRELARGQVGRILASAIVAYVIYMVGAFGIAFLLGATGLFGTGAVAEAVGRAVAFLLYPLYGAVATVLYYDLRIRKDAFDVEVMTRELGGEPHPAALAVG